MPRTLSLLLALATSLGCSDDDATVDAGGADGKTSDASGEDASEPADGSAADGAATDGASADAASDSAADDAGEERIGAFFAVGAAGRRLISCDDGRTWTHDTSFEREGDELVCGAEHSFRCYDEGSSCQFLNGGGECETNADCDCDHHPGSAQGVAFGERNVVATFGWGPPGKVMRTSDGASWDTVRQGDTFGALAYGSGTFLLADRRPWVSTDDGATFVEGGPADFRNGDATIWNTRSAGYGAVDGGRFIMYASSGAGNDMLISSDQGATWWRPTERPEGCNARDDGLGSVGDRLLAITNDNSCWSADGGETWTLSALPEEVGAVVLSDTSRAYAFGRGRPAMLLESEDGETWTQTPLSQADLRLGTVARSPSGTFVAVNAGWQQRYDAQRFYRSEDGISWEELGPEQALRDHRIQYITHGYVDSCP